MPRRTQTLLAVALVLLMLLSSSCSKGKSAAPTAPPPQPPACQLSTTLLEFGTVTVGDSLDKTLTISNTGGGSLSGVLSDTTHQFHLVGGGGYQVAGGNSATITVRFVPRGNGDCRASFSLSSGGCGPVRCTGHGQSATPICFVAPQTVEFGNLSWSQVSTMALTVRNDGGGGLWAVVRGDHGNFRVDSTQAYYVLGPGESATVDVSYTATFSGSEVCTLTVGNNAGCPPVVLRGGGHLTTYGFCSVGTTTPDTVDFGVVTLGQSADRTYSITNYSTDYWAQGVLNNFSRVFTFTGNFFFNMNPGSHQTGTIRFRPDAPGVQICAMQISCSETASGLTPGVQDYVICKGIGVAARSELLPASARRVMRGLPARGR